MMMKKGMFRVLAAAASLTLAATSARADTTASGDGPYELRVVNHHRAPVRLFVLDATGRRRDLGRVETAGERVLEISESVIGRGAFAIEVVPEGPMGVAPKANGVRAQDLRLVEGESLLLLLRGDLNQSVIEFLRG